MTSSRSGKRLPVCARSLRKSAGRESSLFRPGTRCIARTGIFSLTFRMMRSPPNEGFEHLGNSVCCSTLPQGREIPKWFTFREIDRELRRSYPPRSKQGVTIFLTGLSDAGKSTIANALLVKLLELGGRRVTLLDGDVVRKHLSSELGLSTEI
jgi:Mrp family chromosome partitioning ATPase